MSDSPAILLAAGSRTRVRGAVSWRRRGTGIRAM